MQNIYQTITGMDFSDKRKKFKSEKSTETYSGGTKYEKFSEHPAVQPDAVTPLPRSPEEDPEKKTILNITPAKVFVAFGCLACVMIVWIWEIASVREGLMTVEQLKEERRELERTNESLQVEITKLSSSERIERIATEQLHLMRATEKPGVIFIDADKAAALDAKTNLQLKKE